MKKARFNILDAFILVIVLGLVCVVCFKMLGTNEMTAQGGFQPTEYVIKIASVRDFSAEAIPESGNVTLKETGEFAGTIVNKEVKPAQSNLVLTDGSTKTVEVPERYDVYVTVQAEGIQRENGFYVNGNFSVNVGSTNLYHIGNVVVNGTVHEMH